MPLRCGECLTKNYCSRECLLKDSEEKHSKFCHKGQEERKVKGDAKARVEAGLQGLEVTVEEVLKLEQSEEVRKKLVKVKELCEGKDKKKSEEGNSKRGRGKK